MRARSVSVALSVGFLLAAALPVRAAEPASPSAVRLRRFALLVGINDGGPGRARLRYATSDARAVAHVLESLGGVAPGDAVFVADASRHAVEQGFAEAMRLLRSDPTPGLRRELVFYYSGHSDEDGLLLGNDRLSYAELRALIHDAPADLSLAILDSCASGAFTRRKGGVRRPPFLLDASIDTRGHAFLTSSAANEAAQESDRIAASYFTYYLLSGLRGAADANRDRRVTLQEAFQFASQETLARTERTQGGPQHAAYEFDLAGTGDMVVTDVRTTQAGLLLTPELEGRISVREAGGALVAELHKAPGATIELGLDAGAYVVGIEQGRSTFEAQLTLVPGQHLLLARAAFHLGPPLEVAVSRGDGGPADLTAPPIVDRTRFKAGFVPRDVDGRTEVDGFSFGYIADRVARLHGFQLALGYAQVDSEMNGMQLTVGTNLARGGFGGAQISAGANIAQGDSHGTQLAAGANVVDGNFRGFQAAAGGNVVDGDFRGFQSSAGVNTVTGRMSGLQATAGVNVAKEASGLQVAAGLNFAERAGGAQIGVINVAENDTGFRLGVVNVARETHGLDLGVINVAAHDDGESIAVLNLIGDGIHDLSVYGTDALLTNIALKLGGRHLYTEFSFSYQPGDDVAAGTLHIANGDRRWGYGGGFGWRQPAVWGPLAYVDIEAVTTSLVPRLSTTQNAMLNTLRATLGFQVAGNLRVVAGAGVNVMVGLEGRDFDGLLTGWGSTSRDGATTVRIYPGFLLGLEL